MGKHYVPQAHLRRFQIEDAPGFVWMFDKQTKCFAKASISKVAQERDFYSTEVEFALNEEVERPGNVVLEKLIRGGSLENRERTQLSLYLMIMATRGPRRRKKASELVPEALGEVVNEVREYLEVYSRGNGETAELAKRRLEELSTVHAKFTEQIPDNISEMIRTPFSSERTVESIHNMMWHIVRTTTSMPFVTCDTPAHIFDCYGVGTLNSEFTFPISKEVALIGEHQHPFGVVFETAKPQLVKEINRRVLSHAERFVFSASRETWIEQVALKNDPFLSSIVWQ